METHMKVNILDAHDRLKHYKKQKTGIEKTVQKMIDSRPFGDYPFYIYAHTRTLGLDEKLAVFNDSELNYTIGKTMRGSLLLETPKRRYPTLADVPEKRLIWQPRLTKPKASSNSMLFKGYPGSDNIRIIWIIPARELWEQFMKDKLTENETICLSIDLYINHRERLEAKEDDDFSDEKIDAIYREIAHTARNDKMMKRTYDLI